MKRYLHLFNKTMFSIFKITVSARKYAMLTLSQLTVNCKRVPSVMLKK